MNDEKIVVGRADPELRALLDDLIADEGDTLLVGRATKEKLAELREQHCRRYRHRLSSNSPHVNEEETSRLLGLWTAMEGKEYRELDEDQKLEVLDALVGE